MTRSVYVVSAEPSGDALAVDLIAHLRRLDPDLRLHAIGGPAVEGLGFASAIDTAPLSVLGFTEGLRALPQVQELSMRAVQDIVREGPDLVVLIDSWGFMIRVAKLLRISPWNGAVVKYVAPQVWAMRQGRAKLLAKFTDLLLTLYPFDAPYFVRHGLRTDHVGNPVLDLDHASGDGPAFRARHHISALDPLLLVAFGSRASEVERLTPDFVATIERLRARLPGLAVVGLTVPETRAQLAAKLFELGAAGRSVMLVDEGEKLDAMAASDIALAKSGTVTTQLADAGVPTLVAYRVSALTYFFAKRLFKADYVSIVNVAANTALMPEFIQGDLDPETMAERLDGWLSHPVEAKRLSAALREVTDGMRGEGGAGERAALAVLRELDARKPSFKAIGEGKLARG